MSVVKKASLLVGVIGAAATLATTAEGGEGGERGFGKRWKPKAVVVVPAYPVYTAPGYYYAPPPVVYAPQPVYPVYPGPSRGSVYFGATIPLR